eukprot:scaffold125719_cov28-Tisochrysis_lutea.AAC.2
MDEIIDSERRSRVAHSPSARQIVSRAPSPWRKKNMPLYKLPIIERSEVLMLLPYGASQSWLRAPQFVLEPERAARELLAFEEKVKAKPNTAFLTALQQRERRYLRKIAGKRRKSHINDVSRPKFSTDGEL